MAKSLRRALFLTIYVYFLIVCGVNDLPCARIPNKCNYERPLGNQKAIATRKLTGTTERMPVNGLLRVS